MRILSIDLDFILYPCINLYNDLVNCSEERKNIWIKIQKERDINRHIQYDKEKYEFLLKILEPYKNEKIYYNPSHENIVKLIEKIKDKKPFILYNIDHHHDIYYSEEQKKEVKENIINCGDWVGYLDYNNYLEQYFWIKNSNSILYHHNFAKLNSEFIAINFEELAKTQFEKIPKFDYIFITTSDLWFSPILDHLLLEFLNFLKQNFIFKEI